MDSRKNYKSYLSARLQKKFESPYEKFIKEKEKENTSTILVKSNKSNSTLNLSGNGTGPGSGPGSGPGFDKEKNEKIKKAEYICVFNKLNNKNDDLDSYTKGKIILFYLLILIAFEKNKKISFEQKMNNIKKTYSLFDSNNKQK